jgi:hypothetical protein
MHWRAISPSRPTIPASMRCVCWACRRACAAEHVVETTEGAFAAITQCTARRSKAELGIADRCSLERRVPALDARCIPACRALPPCTTRAPCSVHQPLALHTRLPPASADPARRTPHRYRAGCRRNMRGSTTSTTCCGTLCSSTWWCSRRQLPGTRSASLQPRGRPQASPVRHCPSPPHHDTPTASMPLVGGHARGRPLGSQLSPAEVFCLLHRGSLAANAPAL